uniref:Beta-ketoacyl synthase n=1 Tax=Cyanothece sp. (strain PCC 7425 / ATCC 29141) TaxID=395961 RepID=B8HML0_CYAP4
MAAIPVVATGIGLVSALGTTLASNWQRLLKGETGIALHQPFAELPPYPLALIGDRPADLPTLTAEVVQAALVDAQLAPPLADCGIVIGSSRGCQAEWEQWARQWHQQGIPPDHNWLDRLPHAAAVTAAREVGTRGPVLAPMAACATGLWAVAQGYELLQTGVCERVLVGGVEAAVTRLSLSGFAQMGVLARQGAYPFDRQRQGLVLGEGGAVIVLETAELAQRRGAALYGQVLGFGLAADAEHTNAPSQTQAGAIAALKQCLHHSGLTADQVDYIHAHGTATRLNDQFEATLIQNWFPPQVAISSTKGATGHTLGAAGAMGLAFCLLALKHQVLFPTVGLQQPDFALNLIQQPQLAHLQTLLCFSFGFGGQNAIVAVGNPARLGGFQA